MIFEEIIENEYIIRTYNKEINNIDRKSIKKLLKEKKNLDKEKYICLSINIPKLSEIDTHINLVNIEIKKIKDKYNIFIEEL